MAVSVPAQEDPYKIRGRSSDLAPANTEKVPYYRLDANPHVNPAIPGLFAPDGRLEWRIVGDHPERHQLAMQESSLEQQANEIRHRLESASNDTQRSEARTKLAENLGKQFDLRQKRHGLEIEALEAQVKKLKELVQKRQESRAEIISRRVDQVLREAEGLGW
jgi:hypothetical protein